MASTAYCEQVGVNLQLGGVIGDIQRLYINIGTSRMNPNTLFIYLHNVFTYLHTFFIYEQSIRTILIMYALPCPWLSPYPYRPDYTYRVAEPHIERRWLCYSLFPSYSPIARAFASGKPLWSTVSSCSCRQRYETVSWGHSRTCIRDSRPWGFEHILF